MEKEPRRRLKKLKSEPVAQSSNGLIPKKKNLPHQEKLQRFNEDEDDSLDDFITDRVEYDRKGPPTSSEESAHSTDEENFMRKKKKVRESSSESNSDSSHSDISGIDNEFSSESEKGSPKEVLVGKKALEAKRQQGLIPEKKPKHEKKPEKKLKHEKSSKHEKTEKKPEKKVKKKPKKSDDEAEKKKVDSGKKMKDQKKYIQFSEFSEKDRKKAEIVTKVLQRWWYALDDWPPQDFDYSKVLREKKLRLVNKENWSIEPVMNDEGFEKVLALAGYTGLFVNNIGNVFDLRPTQSCPSFDNLFAKSYQEVKEILVKALSNQIEQLKVQPRFDKYLLRELTKELAYYQKQV